jgi:hypothetical protein
MAGTISLNTLDEQWEESDSSTKHDVVKADPLVPVAAKAIVAELNAVQIPHTHATTAFEILGVVDDGVDRVGTTKSWEVDLVAPPEQSTAPCG